MREQAYQQLADLISMAGGIDERKKLQKIVFILKNKGAPFQEKFSYHYFGPYSAELRNQRQLIIQSPRKNKGRSALTADLTDYR